MAFASCFAHFICVIFSKEGLVTLMLLSVLLPQKKNIRKDMLFVGMHTFPQWEHAIEHCFQMKLWQETLLGVFPVWPNESNQNNWNVPYGNCAWLNFLKRKMWFWMRNGSKWKVTQPSSLSIILCFFCGIQWGKTWNEWMTCFPDCAMP